MKKIKQLYLCFLVIFVIFPPISTSHARDLLIDSSGILTSAEEEVLETEMSRLSHVLGYAVGIVTYQSSSEYQQWIEENGEDYILMAVNMQDRRMDLNVGGSAFYAMDDYDKDSIIATVGPYLTAGEYKDGLYAFITMTESYVTGVVSEKELERQKQEAWAQKLPMIQMSLVVSCLVAVGITFGFVKSMNNVTDQENAGEYQGTPNITREREIFLYQNVVSVPRQQNTGGGGSGGGGGRGSYSGGRSGGF